MTRFHLTVECESARELIDALDLFAGHTTRITTPDAPAADVPAEPAATTATEDTPKQGRRGNGSSKAPKPEKGQEQEPTPEPTPTERRDRLHARLEALWDQPDDDADVVAAQKAVNKAIKSLGVKQFSDLKDKDMNAAWAALDPILARRMV